MFLHSLWPNGMWVFAMFDLPIKRKEEKRAYRQFRRHLYQLGMSRIQFSIYAGFVENEKSELRLRENILSDCPQKGAIRIFSVTDAQFSKTNVRYFGEARLAESKPNQFVLFD